MEAWNVNSKPGRKKVIRLLRQRQTQATTLISG